VTPRRLLSFVGAVALFGWGPSVPAASAGKAWTRQQVLALVFGVDDLMDRLSNQFMNAYHPIRGTCGVMPVDSAIEKAVVMPQIHALVTGDAVACYVTSNLGCDAGDWITSGLIASIPHAFTRSKVTIVEQTADRVVADVIEGYYSQQKQGNHVAVTWDEKHGRDRLLTDAEVNAVKDFSRYTISRGKDGVWRISDRKPSFPLRCETVKVDMRPRPTTPLAPLRTPADGKAWTADQIRGFVVRTDTQMQEIYGAEDWLSPDPSATCHGDPIARAIEKPRVLALMRSFVSAKLTDCYIATFLGCQAGDWVGAGFSSSVGPGQRPFSLSKVVIVEQTADRVVADVTEASSDSVDDAGVLLAESGDPEPDASWVKSSSRYTIARERDGVWRISDRKSSDDRYCPSPDRLL